MVQPSGPLAILCGINSSDEIVPVDIDANRQIKVLLTSTTVDAADVTYTPTTPADWDGGVDPGNQDDANDQLAERVKDLEIDSASVLLPTRAFWFHDTAIVTAGGALVRQLTASQRFGLLTYQTGADTGDTNTNSCVLAPGSYTIELLGRTDSSFGQLDIDFKHVNDAGYTSIVANQEWYSAATTYNVSKTATFTVTTPGRHIFKFSTNSKHASSTDYFIYLTNVSIYLTAGDS